jgi:cytochrome b561
MVLRASEPKLQPDSRPYPAPPTDAQQRKLSNAMLYTLALVLLALWLLGLVSSYTMGGFIHVLLVIAIVMVILKVINGRKVV